MSRSLRILVAVLAPASLAAAHGCACLDIKQREFIFLQFLSNRALAARKVPGWLPLDLVLTQRFDSLAKVGSLRMPVLFIHGTADRIVPHAMSEQLFAAAPEPRRLVLVAGGGHSNISWSLFEQCQAAIAAFRKSVETPASNSASTAPGG